MCIATWIRQPDDIQQWKVITKWENGKESNPHMQSQTATVYVEVDFNEECVFMGTDGGAFDPFLSQQSYNHTKASTIFNRTYFYVQNSLATEKFYT